MRNVSLMPDLGKLSQQGMASERETMHALFVREAIRQGVGDGEWCHANAWCDAGRPKQWLALWPATPDGRIRSMPVNYPDLHDVAPMGESYPSALAYDLQAAGVRVVDNPDYRGCVRPMSASVKAALYCETVAGGAGRDGWGVASHQYDGHDAEGNELHVVAAAGIEGQCRGGDEAYPLAPPNREVSLTTGGGDAAMPHGQRRVTLAEASHCYRLEGLTARERKALQAGYTAPISTDDDAPKNAKARRKALRLANGTTKTAAQQ